MRITKQMASDVAKQLCAEKQNQIDGLKKQQADYVTALYLSWLPQDIKDAFAKHQSFFRKTSSFYLSGHGLSHDYFNLSGQQPDGTLINQKFSAEQAKVIVDYGNKISDLQKNVRELQRGIEVALFSLTTYKNVERGFPEAFKLLPADKAVTGLMINVKDIRCQLDASVC